MRRRGRWDNWAAIAAGLALALSWTWHYLLGFPGGFMMVLGLITIMASTISITRPGAVSSEAAVAGAGVLAFLLPWLLAFTGSTAAAATAWVLGAVIAILGVIGLVAARANVKRDPELAWGNHMPQSA
ncbi:SPW repeat domain-containing protein [Nocardiopsis salina]|uniref:SPW repeat domain-containing protein n=1 Tax=Nocardiopsis salina TaxID=245836 RepID=UPI0003484FC3|nr:hypothetical protein [Nocardiopsis salina]